MDAHTRERGGAMLATSDKRQSDKRQVQMPSDHAHSGRALREQEKWFKTRDACVALQKELQPSAFSYAPDRIAQLAESVCSKVSCSLSLEQPARREWGGRKTGVEGEETPECVTCDRVAQQIDAESRRKESKGRRKRGGEEDRYRGNSRC